MGNSTITSYRQGAEEVLNNMLARKKAEMEVLELLKKIIPWDKLTPEDEEKLWHFLAEIVSVL